MPIRVHIIQGQVIHAPVFSEARFFRVPVFLGPGFSGTSFLRVQVQVLEVAKRNTVLLKFSQNLVLKKKKKRKKKKKNFGNYQYLFV